MPLPSRMPSKSAQNKEGEYSLVKGSFAYHAREDQTLLPTNTLVSPSKNVVNNTSNRLSLVKGYTLDGSASTVIDSGILSNTDFITTAGYKRNLRAGFMTSAGNDGKLQYRYVDSTGTVTWRDLKTSLTSIRLCFDGNFFATNNSLHPTNEGLKLLLWVDGQTNKIFEWNGAITTLASGTGLVAGVVSTVAAAPTAGGANYKVGDILTLTGGNGDAKVMVATLTGSAVATVTLYQPGTGGLTVTTGIATTGGSGTGCTISVTAIATLASITKQGTTTWAQEGFYLLSNKHIVINGVDYTYTGGENTTTLMGLSADLSSVTAGTIVHQQVVTTSLNNMTGILTTFIPSVIGCGRNNQIYLGSALSNILYISKVSNYTDYSFTSSQRIVGEGFNLTMDAAPVKFIAQEVHGDGQAYDMWISTGEDRWAIIRSTLANNFDSNGIATSSSETLEFLRLKTGPLQGALSEKLVSKAKNHIIFIGHDNVCNSMGYISYQFVPVMEDISYPIINDMNSYDFTDGSIFFFKNYIYIAVPKHGLIRIYNMTDQSQEQYSNYNPTEQLNAQQPFYWEAPVGYPISGFYVVDGELYGHGYNTSESYKLFTGGSFNGQDIDANATFAFDDYGDRTQSKGSNELWVEGYIKQNTKLSATVTGDLNYFSNSQTMIIDGINNSIVSYGGGGHSLGQDSLGSRTLGGTLTSTDTLPAWFHVSLTYPQVPFYLEQISFSTKGTDLQWELLTFGTNKTFTPEGNNSITI